MVLKGRVGSSPTFRTTINLNYSRVEANPPHPYIKVEAVTLKKTDALS
jgi:hypothetical protein